ncbi:uncharacterized protein LOC131670302 [Phymastichus coffea]|uniref:uncharacterized protein LOC131670302 n=1 Tax=Phymastichus coffea TaxID=108790 RepID=UPI00273C77AD|nr:uncharacterized protein LOC131670302 [Phymastichus coffea]
MRAPSTLLLGLAILIIGESAVESFRALPNHLRECYRGDGSFAPKLPLNLRAILDVLRKVERRTRTSLTIRTLSAALVKRYKLDGVTYSGELPAREGVLRFAANGAQRAKQRIVQELMPGDDALLPADALTRDERCLLHFAMSNTIWVHSESREESFCAPGPNERSLGNVAPARSRSVRSIAAMADQSFDPRSHFCPKEGGVILSPYNTLALGSVVSAVAAALEPQRIKPRLLLDMPVDEDDGDVEFVVPRDQIDRSMWLQSMASSEVQIDNVWIATISGELAELVIYQGPIYDDRMYLGSTGFWNSTIRPRIFYISHRTNNFELTRAEIVGAVDGLIIAKNMDSWISKFANLRLSQVLDMYYSDKGMVFDRNVKACQRGMQFPRVAPKVVMEEQTYAASQVLAYLNSKAAMTTQALQRIVARAVNSFSKYTDDYLFTEVQCRGRRRRQNKVELVVAFDGAWTRSYTADFLAALLDDFDVSIYGSRMGIMHGESGQWLRNMTDSPTDLYRTIDQLSTFSWPRKLELAAVFQSIQKYLDDSWERLIQNHTVANLGQAVVLLVPRITLDTEETQLAMTALKKLKSKHPETHFLYYTHASKVEMLRKFLLTEEDRIVDSMEIDDISRILATVPMTLRSAGCNKNLPGVRLQFEDYIYPSETIIYRLHPQWRIRAKRVPVTFHGVGYGTMTVCLWNQHKMNLKQTGKRCKALSLYGEISLENDYQCEENNKCPSTYFQIKNVTTNTRCAELDCRTPDQVRFIVRTESFQCLSTSTTIYANLFLLVTTALYVLN